MAMLVSGGHSSLLLVPDVTHDVRSLGSTMDDAAGEAFDKVARVLGLPFPGGPHVDRAAREGNRIAIDFPRGLTTGRDMERHRFDFSFSGLKTAVARWVETRQRAGETVPVADVAASFQEAVVDVLTRKALLACKEHDVDHLLIGGGVAANSAPAGPRRGAVRQGRRHPARAPARAVHRQRGHGRGARGADGGEGARAERPRASHRLVDAGHARPGLGSLSGPRGWGRRARARPRGVERQPAVRSPRLLAYAGCRLPMPRGRPRALLLDQRAPLVLAGCDPATRDLHPRSVVGSCLGGWGSVGQVAGSRGW